jgi:hypothetical protein
MNNLKNELSETEKGLIKAKKRTKLKNILNPLMIIFGAIAGFTSGHLRNVFGIVLFSISIIAIGMILYLYYFKK